MAADELLAVEAVRLGRPLVRLYGWTTTTFSLGAFQRFADAAAAEAVATLPLVRRPSGGGGIVHGSDLTYAVAVPRDHPWGGEPQVLYDAFHESLAAELRHRGVAAALHAGRDRAAGDEGRLLCFDRRARGDLVVQATGPDPDGHKIMGSAQRRLAGAVVQHGSLLLRESPGVGPAARHPGVENLHPGFETYALRQLADAWLTRLAAAMGTDFGWEPGAFTPPPHDELRTRLASYTDPRWLARR